MTTTTRLVAAAVTTSCLVWSCTTAPAPAHTPSDTTEADDAELAFAQTDVVGDTRRTPPEPDSESADDDTSVTAGIDAESPDTDEGECQTYADCPSTDGECDGRYVCDQGVCVLVENDALDCIAECTHDAECPVLDDPCGGRYACTEGTCELTDSDGSECNDGDACTVADTCDDEVCGGIPIDCDDDDPCTAEHCEPTSGCSYEHSVVGTGCDDGDPCTETDTCAAGKCSGTPLACVDDDPCTVDSCDPVAGCSFVVAQDGDDCDDGDACSADETCEAGSCGGGVELSCDDGSECTADSCVADIGCVNTPTNEGAACDDGDDCTINDSCTNGECVATPLDCDDDDECTTDVCDAIDGCVHNMWADGTPGSDGSGCTTDDVCKEGQCLGSPLECLDGSACTMANCVDVNADKGLCVYLPSGESKCDDGNPCTSDDSCLFDECGGVPIICDDGDECTVDSCTPDEGCVFSPNPAGCPPE